jgi:hypothetical protein
MTIPPELPAADLLPGIEDIVEEPTVELTEEQQAALDLLKDYVGTTDLTDNQLIAILAIAEWNADAAAARIWSKVAADTYKLVTVSESGSSRTLSDVHKNALAMSKLYTERAETEEEVAATNVRPRTRAIVRV